MLAKYPGERITFYLLMLFAFLMPVAPFLVPVVSAVFIINWFLSGDFRRFKLIFKHPLSAALLLMMGFWLFSALSLVYSSNLGEGLLKLEVKLSLLLMPLVIGASSFRSSSLKQQQSVFHSFVVGTLFSVLFLILAAAWKSLDGFTPEHWFYTGFSFQIHPTYYSMYLLFSAAILWFLPPTFMSKKWNVSAYFLLVIALIFTGSKAGAMGLFVLTAIIFLHEYHNRNINLLSGLRLILPLLLFLVGLFLLPPAMNRMRETQETAEMVTGQRENNQGGYPSSTGMRLVLWKSALKVWAENPVLGVGLGDAHDELDKKYKDINLTLAYQKHLNAHNQYLQTAVAGGTVALLLLLVILTLPLFRFHWHKSYLAWFFLALCAMNFLFEAILEKQAGMVFFAFFYILLLLTIQKETNESAV
jgi:O-antigen ligase